MPSPEDSLFDDLNTHQDELEELRKALNETFDIEIEEDDFDNVELVEEIVQIVKDYVSDIS